MLVTHSCYFIYITYILLQIGIPVSNLDFSIFTKHSLKTWDIANQENDPFERTMIILASVNFIPKLLDHKLLNSYDLLVLYQILQNGVKYLYMLKNHELYGYSLDHINNTLMPAFNTFWLATELIDNQIREDPRFWKSISISNTKDPTANQSPVCLSKSVGITYVKIEDVMLRARSKERDFVFKFNSLEELFEAAPHKICSICLEEMSLDMDIMRLNCCCHVFHTLCSWQWLQRKR